MTIKNWLITGISSGLGKALAEQAVKNGDFVIGTFRNKHQIENFNKKYSGKAIAYKLDVTNASEIEKTIYEIIEKHKKIDVLVNNAGVGFVGAVEETSTDEVRAVFEANFFGALKVTQTVLPYMRTHKSGNIIQISSHGGIKAFAGFGIYNASKFALEGFSEALAQEVAPLGIKVSIIEPGPFRTNFASSTLGEAEKVIDDYNETAGNFRAKLKSVNGKQEGDPNKAALAIIDLVEQDQPSLRLPLGKIPLTTIQMKLDSVQKDLDTNKTVAEGSVY